MNNKTRMTSAKSSLSCLAVVLIVASFIIYAGIISFRSSRLDKRFSASLSFSTDKRINARHYIRGKMVPILTNDKSVDSIWRELPRDIQAQNDSEVETIVLITYRFVGETDDSPGGRGIKCAEVQFIDRKIPAKVGRTISFYKQHPNLVNRKRRSSPVSYISDQIVAYLKSVPRTPQPEILDVNPYFPNNNEQSLDSLKRQLDEVERLIEKEKEKPKKR